MPPFATPVLLAIFACYLLLAQPNSASPLGKMKESVRKGASTEPESLVFRCALSLHTPKHSLLRKESRYTSCSKAVRNNRALSGTFRDLHKILERSPILPDTHQAKISSPISESAINVRPKPGQNGCTRDVAVLAVAKGKAPKGKDTVILTTEGNDNVFIASKGASVEVDDQEEVHDSNGNDVVREEDDDGRDGYGDLEDNESRSLATFVVAPKELKDVQGTKDCNIAFGHHDYCRCVRVICRKGHYWCVCKYVCDLRRRR